MSSIHPSRKKIHNSASRQNIKKSLDTYLCINMRSLYAKYHISNCKTEGGVWGERWTDDMQLPYMCTWQKHSLVRITSIYFARSCWMIKFTFSLKTKRLCMICNVSFSQTCPLKFLALGNSNFFKLDFHLRIEPCCEARFAL